MYQEQSYLAFQLLVKSQMLDAPTDLEELMRYPPSPVPHVLGSPHGFFAKTNKATILHYLLQDADKVTYPKDALFIQDGNALSHDEQPATNIWRNLPTALESDEFEAALCLFYRLLQARFYQSSGKAQAWLFRSIHSQWSSYAQAT